MLTWQVTLVLMLLGHLVADYTLQGWLADGKQKSWWQKACGQDEIPKKYRNDYKMALYCHGLYWSILVCAPFYASNWLLVAVVVNAIVHADIDDFKANEKVINLVQDQLLHLGQILITFGILITL